MNYAYIICDKRRKEKFIVPTESCQATARSVVEKILGHKEYQMIFTTDDRGFQDCYKKYAKYTEVKKGDS